jgi:O-antigen/teichoic acid export membrane protein
MKLKKLLAKVKASGLIATALGRFGLRIGSAGLGFVNGVIIARLLGPRELGIYTLLMATTTLAATIATLGLPSLITRQLASYVVHGQWGVLKGLINKSRLWILLSSLAAIAVVVTLQKLGVLDNRLHPFALVVMLSLIPLLALSQQRSAILRGLHWVILADVPELILRPLFMTIMLGLYLLLIPRADSNQVMLMYFVAVGIAFITGLYFVRRRTPVEVRAAQAETTGWQWFVATLPFFAMTLSGTFENQVALYILSYRTDSYQVGLFQVANQLVGLVLMGLAAVNMPLQPMIAAAWARGDRAAIQKLASQAVRLSTVVALISCIILIAFAEPLLKLYGQPYQAAASTLRILAMGQLFYAAAGSCGLILAMTGHQNMTLFAQCLALMVNSAAAWLLTPQWGAMGAAMAATLGLITWNSLLVIASLRKVHINTTILPFKFKSLVR